MTDAREELARVLKDPDWSKPENVRALINAIWEVTHSDKEQGEMLMELCLLSGIATAVLMDYIKMLEIQNH